MRSDGGAWSLRRLSLITFFSGLLLIAAAYAAAFSLAGASLFIAGWASLLVSIGAFVLHWLGSRPWLNILLVVVLGGLWLLLAVPTLLEQY